MSPEGFWPDPRTDMFDQSNNINSPPWEVPRKRKNRGKELFYFDFCNEELMKCYSGEVTTANKFEVLVDDPIEDPMVHIITTPSKRKMYKKINQEPQDDNFSNAFRVHTDYDDYCENTFNLNLYDNLLFNFIKCKAINFCKSYFLDIIDLDDPTNSLVNDNSNKKQDIVSIRHVVEDKGKYKVKYLKKNV